jgi:Asp-tRNA(Asn)/Glu-tRNA(Gln) amidotransferase A subunit family amidase
MWGRCFNVYCSLSLRRRDRQLGGCDARNRCITAAVSGILISIKDVFDVAQSVTTAGSAVLADALPQCATR